MQVYKKDDVIYGQPSILNQILRYLHPQNMMNLDQSARVQIHWMGGTVVDIS